MTPLVELGTPVAAVPDSSMEPSGCQRALAQTPYRLGRSSMVRKLLVPLSIVALCATASGVRAADNQSIHCRGNAPAAAGAAGSTQNDDLRLSVKADGLPSIGTGSIDLVSGEAAQAVTTKAMKQMCVAA